MGDITRHTASVSTNNSKNTLDYGSGMMKVIAKVKKFTLVEITFKIIVLDKGATVIRGNEKSLVV